MSGTPALLVPSGPMPQAASARTSRKRHCPTDTAGVVALNKVLRSAPLLSAQTPVPVLKLEGLNERKVS